MSNKDEQAFPLTPAWGPSGDLTFSQCGLTKREYAAIRLQAALVEGSAVAILLDRTDADFASKAVGLADALFTELEKEPT